MRPRSNDRPGEPRHRRSARIARPGEWRGFRPGCWASGLLAEGASMRRAVVTGLGVVAPNGVGREAFWKACLEGRSGVGPIRAFDASAHPVRIAAEVPDFDINQFVPHSQRKSLKIMGRA